MIRHKSCEFNHFNDYPQHHLHRSLFKSLQKQDIVACRQAVLDIMLHKQQKYLSFLTEMFQNFKPMKQVFLSLKGILPIFVIKKRFNFQHQKFMVCFCRDIHCLVKRTAIPSEEKNRDGT